MTNYELTLLARPDATADDVANAIKNIYTAITSSGATVLHTEYWGLRDLAYHIAKKASAHFYFLQYSSNLTINDSLMSRLKINDIFIRYLIVKADDSSISIQTANSMESKSDEDSGMIFDEKYAAVLKNLKV